MPDTMAGFEHKLDGIANSLEANAMHRILDKVGMQAKKDIAHAVTDTLGDDSMSHWRRGRPIKISGRYDAKNSSTIEITPSRSSGGPMRVLESGRTAGMSKGRRGRPSRRVSASDGKHTWTHAEETMKRTLPRVVHTAVVASLRKTFGG